MILSCPGCNQSQPDRRYVLVPVELPYVNLYPCRGACELYVRAHLDQYARPSRSRKPAEPPPSASPDYPTT